MIKSEIHKCIIKNGLWKIIIFFLLIKICSVCVQQYDYNELIESNKKNYLDILEWAGGKVDGSKEEKINKFYNNLVKKVKARNELQQFQQNNRIGIDEYKKKYIELTHEIEGRDAFNLVYHQYVKARENPDKIWIIYDNGLNAFWSQTAPDHFLIMLLMFGMHRIVLMIFLPSLTKITPNILFASGIEEYLLADIWRMHPELKYLNQVYYYIQKNSDYENNMILLFSVEAYLKLFIVIVLIMLIIKFIKKE